MDILRTEITVQVGISVCVDGDWIKTGHQIMSEVKGYPECNEIAGFIRNSLDASMDGCAEQTQLLVDKINARVVQA